MFTRPFGSRRICGDAAYHRSKSSADRARGALALDLGCSVLPDPKAEATAIPVLLRPGGLGAVRGDFPSPVVRRHSIGVTPAVAPRDGSIRRDEPFVEGRRA